MRDGVPAQTAHGSSLLGSVTETGVYRVEAYLKIGVMHRPWIFSNPIYVLSTPS
jgi:hypothetical protein